MDTCQIKFRILNEKYDIVYGGIYVEDTNEKYVICGCCGHIFPVDEIEIIKRYDDWNDLSNEIVGDEL